MYSYGWERTMREIPSFSSSLLDEIYRSIDEEGGKKQSQCGTKAGEVEVLDRIGRVERRAKERETIQRRQVSPEREKNQRRSRYLAHDALFLSSASSSSDSSSNGLSSSDTESAYSGVKTRARASCFVPLPRPKPVRTSDGTGGRTEFSPFQEQGKLPGFDGGDEGIMNSKSRALKIYTNLKKMKQPISPGGKLASFVNSLFAARKAVPYSEEGSLKLKGKFKSGDSSTCSSASSFTRSWKLTNVSKRTVQLYPVNVILDEGEKSVRKERQESEKEKANKMRSVSSPDARNIGKKVHQVEEETAREFLRNYHRNQKKNVKTTGMTSQSSHRTSKNDDDDRDYEDDAASCTSSDLFELDHLSVLGNDMYCEELPVYGTTRVGLIMSHGRNGISSSSAFGVQRK